MTTKHVELLRFIRAYIAEHECSPTLEECAQHMGLATRSGAHRMVAIMVRDGILEHTPGAIRSVREKAK